MNTGPNSYSSLDQKRFEELFKSHFQSLCHFAKQYVQDEDTAQDICQKVFISLWQKRAEIDPKQSVVSYLFTAVKNRCLNHIRDHKKYRSKVLDLDLAEEEWTFQDDHFVEEELKEKIAEALAILPEKCRKVFEMSRYQEMTYKEIAEELGIAQKTVEAHMSKAIKTLRIHLKDYLLVYLIILGWI
ncbi:MAG: RNA polymerase sigma-70 factor [Cyanothece sp. SIO1E1]|nr:RNA polymerase sigma-70 factor [Cyanothece sp. SIO1E1]